MKELILYCDESTKDGPYFSNFYGGALTTNEYLDDIIDNLRQKKLDNNIHGEIKWTKVTEAYLDKYIDIINTFFDYIEQDKIKMRIMFTQNAYQATGLKPEHHDNRYFLLYYQFIKNAFGLKYCNLCDSPYKEEVNIKILFDLLPDKSEKRTEFKRYIQNLETSDEFRQSNIKIRMHNIGEVESHKHDILQCADIILGAMQFRLNDLHKYIPPGQKRRGKRTIAKEKLYKHIYRRINCIHSNFNPGISTGLRDKQNNWQMPYCHWRFIPSSWEYNKELTK